MDLLSLAQHRFEQIAPSLARPMTSEASDAVETWLRDRVCPVAEALLPNPRFREWALWSLSRLSPGSPAPERRLVEAVDRALVEAAGDALARARGLGLLPASDGGDAGPRTAAATSGLSLLSLLASRPWVDLAYPGEYFDGGRLLHLWDTRADCTAELLAANDIRAPLGDYVARAMFARIDYFSRKIREACGACDAAPRGGPRGGDVDRLSRALEVRFALERAIVALRRQCHVGDAARLRDACTTLVQVYAAYAPEPDLGWMEGPWARNPAGAQLVRLVVRPVGERIDAELDDRGRLRVLGRSYPRLCRPDVALGVAGALAVVAGLYRRPIEADELIDWLACEKRLVLVDRRPRAVFWDGGRVERDWDRYPLLWDLLWTLALRASRRMPVDQEELLAPGVTGNAVKHRRSRLASLIPPALDALIEAVPTKGYRLAIDPGGIALLHLDREEQLIEVGAEGISPLG